MDNLENLICNFHKIKNTHPNLSNLWINYLTLTKHKFQSIKTYNETLETAKYTLELISDEQYNDLTRENILILLWLSLH
jgi:hypothetical protein